jgi:hypothetical protein
LWTVLVVVAYSFRTLFSSSEKVHSENFKNFSGSKVKKSNNMYIRKIPTYGHEYHIPNFQKGSALILLLTEYF